MNHLKLAASLLALTAAAPALAQTTTAPSPAVEAVGTTAPTAQGGANGVVLLRHPTDPAKSVIAASAELAGLEFYGLEGQRIASVPGGEVEAVDARDDNGRAILAVLDSQGGRLRLFARDWAGGQVSAIDAKPLMLGYSGEGLCLHRSARDGSLYAFAMGRDGQLDQWLLFPTATEGKEGGKVDGRVVRRLRLSSEAKYCVADDASGALYVAQAAVGIWRYDADPEAEPVPVIVDINRLGHIAGEVGGLAVVNGGKGADYLIAANADAGVFNVYDRGAGDRFLGGFSAGAIENPSALFGLRAPVGPGLPAGGLLIADDRKQGAHSKVLSWADVAAALKLPVGVDAPVVPPSKLALVHATMETEPVDHDGDAADDPAIWVHPTDPRLSVIIGTDKKGGLAVYDLSGKRLQFLPDGKMNNVDLRGGFKLGGKTVTLIAASDRTHKSIALYTIDPVTRLLSNVADGLQPTDLSDPYGLCMHRDRKGRTFVFVGDPDGLVRQWALTATATGKVKAQPVRDIRFDTQTEGCVADDETGALYVAEEDVALWKLGADAKSGQARKAVARVVDNAALKDDLEGVGLYAQPGGKGYLVVSSQGNNTYAVFRREGDNAYVGSFAVTANGANGVDGISETDGLEVTSASLGAGLEGGAFVAQDGRNISPPEHQNFKLVPWSAIAAKLKL